MVELGRSAVHGNHYIFARFVSGSLDGGNDGVQGIFCTLQIRSKTSFIAYCCAEATVFQDFLQCMEHFGTHTQTFAEGSGTYGAYHEFLESNGSVTVRTAVDDVHHRYGHHIGICTTDISVEWDVEVSGGSLGHGKRYAEDGIGTQIGFRFGSVQCKHGMVDTHLVEGGHTDELGSNDIIDIVHGFQDTFASVTFFVTVTQFQCFVFSRGCS